MAEPMPDTVLNVTVIPPSGIPEKKSYPDHTKVEHVIKMPSPPERSRTGSSTSALTGPAFSSDPNQALKDAGVEGRGYARGHEEGGRGWPVQPRRDRSLTPR